MRHAFARRAPEAENANGCSPRMRGLRVTFVCSQEFGKARRYKFWRATADPAIAISYLRMTPARTISI